MERRVLEAQIAYFVCELHEQVAQHDADEQCDEKAIRKLTHCVENRKIPGHDRGDGELKRDDARCVVEQRLALQHCLLPVWNGCALRHGRHSEGVGRAERRTESERRSKRHRRHDCVKRETDCKRDCHDQPDSIGEHGVAVVPQRGLVRLARFVEQQRCDEQHEEQLGIQRYRNALLRKKRHGNAAGDLDERKRQARQKLVDDGGREHGCEEHQCKLECSHPLPPPSLRFVCVAFW